MRGLLGVGRAHFFDNAHRFDGRAHVVHAQNVRPFEQRDGVDHRRSVERLRRIGSEQFVDHRFATHPHEQRESQFVEIVELVEQRIVVLHGFAESEARIEDDVVCPEFAQALHAARQPLNDVCHHVVILRIALHGAGRALQVHQDVRHTESCHGVKHRAVECAAGDVVDELHPVVSHAVQRHFRAKGVDRQQRVRSFLAHHFECRGESPHFFVGTHLVGARTSGVGAHIDAVRALLHECAHAPAQGFDIAHRSARVGKERIGGGIEDAHHQRAVEGKKVVVDAKRVCHDLKENATSNTCKVKR